MLTHQASKLAMHDTHQGLPRSQATHNLLPQRSLFHLRGEFFYHGQGDIRFEQGQTYFAQRVLNIVLGQACLATQIFYYAGEALGQVVQHICNPFETPASNKLALQIV